MIYKTTSTGSEDTERLGELLASQIKTPFLIELVADLGGGKTTFVKGLARGLKSQSAVSSPTFTLSRVYKCAGGKQIHHYDFYRLPEPGVLKEQVKESLMDDNVLTVVEWSDIVKDALPKKRLGIELKPTANDPEEREIIINYPEEFASLIRHLEQQQGRSEP